LIADSNNVVLLLVDKVSREKQVVIFKNIADLKGKDFGAAADPKGEGVELNRSLIETKRRLAAGERSPRTLSCFLLSVL
jgi:hypothetical protein